MEYIKLSKVDKMILDSYIPVIKGLAAYMSDAYEFVLHSLEDYDHSVISIINGSHTGRTVGAPITDLALKMLSGIEDDNEKDYIVYFTHNKDGEPLKSTTIAIRGENNRIIGLLCINFYMNTPLSYVISSLTAPSDDNSKDVKENFASDPNLILEQTYNSIREAVMNNPHIKASNKNKVIVEKLYDRGIFRIKNSVLTLEKLMKISKNTIYMHIRNYNKKD